MVAEYRLLGPVELHVDAHLIDAGQPRQRAVLAALLVDVSEGLLDGGRRVAREAPGPEAALRALVDFHVDFALMNAAVIRVQDRDLDSLSEADRRTVRTLQRRYVEVWVGVLARLRPQEEPAALRNRAHAVFGLINSTPHTTSTSGSTSGSASGRRAGARTAKEAAALRALLERMAWAALNA